MPKAVNLTSSRRLFKWASGGTVVVALLLVWSVFVYPLGRTRAGAGISMGDVALGGLTWSDAGRAMAEVVKRRQQQPLSFNGESGLCSLTLENLGGTFEAGRTEARLRELSTQRVGARGWWLGKVVLAPILSFDPSRFDSWISDCEARAVAKHPSVGRIVLKDGDFAIEPSQPGRRVDKLRMANLIGEAVSRIDESALGLPLIDQPESPTLAALERAKKLGQELVSKAVVLRASDAQARVTMLRADLAKMFEWQPDENGELAWHLSRSGFEQWLGTRRHRVEQRARDATYTLERERLVVVPEQKGSLIAMGQLFSLVERGLREGQHQFEIPFEPTELPKRVVADLAQLNIHEPVGTFTTRHACCQPRVNNIHRIADLIDGTIVLPGETYSVNEHVGQRTLENGFVPAPSIEDGEMVDTVGGGVSQFATTIYNALLRAGYEVLERQAHTYWFDRYPMGHEATLSWPKPDIVFRNDTASGLLILTSYTDRSITVRLFGDREGRSVDVSVSPRFDLVRPGIEYLPDPELSPEKEHVKEGGCIGWSVWTMRTVTLKDGSTKKDKRKVIYKPRIRRVEVHPCKIPSGEPGHTGEKCPKIEPDSLEESSSPATE
jgi:vancomycin resistance protein YoaR